jgi:hypothetical protein
MVDYHTATVHLVGKDLLMESTPAKRLDTFLGICQKFTVIGGVLVSVWFFMVREESAPHVQMDIDAAIMPGCVARVILDVENLGGRVWNIGSAVTRLYQPDLDRRRDSKNLQKLEVGTQILPTPGKLLIGESTSLVFSIKLSEKPQHAFLVVQTTIMIQEEDQQWIRIQENTVPTGDCS